MKLNMVFCMNCHGGYIIRNIKKYNHKILDDYNIHYIQYVGKKYLIDNKLTDDDIKLIKQANILIIQYIKNDRGMLNHNYIKQIATTNNIYILPHYTFDGYFHNNVTDKLIKENKTISQIENASEKLNINIDKIVNNFNENMSKIKNLDKLSFGNMFSFVKNNNKKFRLFQNNGHPNNLFFIELTNQLLQKIGYTDKLEGVYTNHSNHSNQICLIYPQVQNVLGLEFDCNINFYGIVISTNQYLKIINYKTCFNANIVNKINYLTRNIKKKYVGTSTFFHLLNKDLLIKIIKLIE